MNKLCFSHCSGSAAVLVLAKHPTLNPLYVYGLEIKLWVCSTVFLGTTIMESSRLEKTYKVIQSNCPMYYDKEKEADRRRERREILSFFQEIVEILETKKN